MVTGQPSYQDAQSNGEPISSETSHAVGLKIILDKPQSLLVTEGGIFS